MGDIMRKDLTISEENIFKLIYKLCPTPILLAINEILP
jgi:hypothetical protein